MSDFEILTSKDSQKWKEYLSMLPIEQQDVYFTPEYYSLYEANGDGSARCFVFKKDGDIALYPFLINKINDLGYDLDDEYYDIQGAYGYNGIVASNASRAFTLNFIDKFFTYIHDQHVVTEFIRINPLLISNYHYSDHFMLLKQNTIYYTNLRSGNILYEEYEHSTRKNINKARRENLTVKSNCKSSFDGALIEEFCEIYYATMNRNKADKFYYFSYDYTTSLVNSLREYSRIYVTFIRDKAISAELVLFDQTRAYSFLGGTLSDYFTLRPNDLLKHEIINDMKTRGLEYFVLGGGTTEGDGISKYKKSFGKNNASEFYIAKKVHNRHVYDQIVDQWQRKHPLSAAKYGHMLQGYRKLDA